MDFSMASGGVSGAAGPAPGPSLFNPVMGGAALAGGLINLPFQRALGRNKKKARRAQAAEQEYQMNRGLEQNSIQQAKDVEDFGNIASSYAAEDNPNKGGPMTGTHSSYQDWHQGQLENEKKRRLYALQAQRVALTHGKEVADQFSNLQAERERLEGYLSDINGFLNSGLSGINWGNVRY